MRRITTTERRSRLAVRHRLTAGHHTDDVVAITDDLVALHSSDPATVFLSVGARMVEPDVGPLDCALHRDRSLVRHHAFRRTLWVMTPSVARLAHASATAKIAAAERRKLVKVLDGADHIEDPEHWIREAIGSVRALLAAEGPLSTREIGKRLPALARPVTIAGGTKNAIDVAAHTRLLLVAGFAGELVRTQPSHGWNSSEYAWDTPERWLGATLHGAEPRAASAQFLARWLDRFGPATETDLRWWTGWTLGRLRTALADIDAEEVRLDHGSSGWVGAGDRSSPDAEPWVALLPGLDPTTMGWKERSWYVDDRAVARTFDRSSNAGPTIWRNGEVVGGWAHRRDGTVALELYAEFTRGERLQLDEQVDRFRSLVGDTWVRPRFPSRNQKDLLRV